MHSFNVDVNFPWKGTVTEKVSAVMRFFGLNLEKLRAGSIRHKLDIELGPGQICYITGASGAGKSVLMKELYSLAPAALDRRY